MRFCALTCSGIARLSLINSRGGTCYYPSLRDFVEWARGRPYASPRRARASLVYVTRSRSCHANVYAKACVPCVCPVCQESIRGVYRAGESRGGRIDIKIVTEFRRAATYPNALGFALKLPVLLPHSTLSLSPSLLETAFPFYAPFRTFPREIRCTRTPRVTGPEENFSTGEEENIVVNRQSKFPTVAQKPEDNIERAGGSEDVRHKNTWRHEDLWRACISIYGASKPLRRGWTTSFGNWLKFSSSLVSLRRVASNLWVFPKRDAPIVSVSVPRVNIGNYLPLYKHFVNATFNLIFEKTYFYKLISSYLLFLSFGMIRILHEKK